MPVADVEVEGVAVVEPADVPPEFEPQPATATVKPTTARKDRIATRITGRACARSRPSAIVRIG